MGIFDDVVINAKSAANAVGKKAEQIVDLSKLKYAAAGLSAEISKKKEELGDYVFQSSKSGDIDHDAMKDKIKELIELEENYNATKEMIVSAKNKRSCKECGFENNKEAVFCNKCGAKLEEEAQPDTTDDSAVADDEEAMTGEEIDNAAETATDNVTVAVAEEKLDDITDTIDDEVSSDDETNENNSQKEDF